MAKSKSKKQASQATAHNRAKMNAYILSKKVDGERFRAFLDGQNSGYTEAAVTVMYVLHDYFGFGHNRLKNFMNTLMGYTEMYVKPAGEYKGITTEDMAWVLEDECKIKVDLETGMIDFSEIHKETLEIENALVDALCDGAHKPQEQT